MTSFDNTHDEAIIPAILSTDETPNWILYVWAVQDEARNANVPNPFGGIPHLCRTRSGFIETYVNGGVVIHNNTDVTISHPRL